MLGSSIIKFIIHLEIVTFMKVQIKENAIQIYYVICQKMFFHSGNEMYFFDVV